MKRTVRFLVIVGLAMAVPTVLLVIQHQRSKGALRRYVAALRAKNEKLTLAELAVPPSTNAEHVASRQVFATNEFQFDGGNPALMVMVAPGEAEITWQSAFRPGARTTISSNAPATSWDAFDRRNEQTAPAVAAFRRALENPAPDAGFNYQTTREAYAPQISYVRMRMMAQALASAEIGELRHGNFDGAFTNLHELAGLSRLYRNELTLVSCMIRVAISDLGLRGTWEALQATNWDEPRLAALQHDWEQVDLIDALERACRGERAEGFLLMDKARHARPREFEQFFYSGNTTNTNRAIPLGNALRQEAWVMAYRLTSVDEDELYRLQFMTRQLDVVRMLKTGRPWPEVNAAATNLIGEIDRDASKIYYRRFIVSWVSIPNISRAVARAVEAETLRRLAVSAIAIKRYQIAHSRAPPNLAALTPEFLKDVLIDPMSGKPLGYRLNADGTFVLYSAGEDGKDDGGVPGLDLWSGPDAVWPAGVAE